MDSTLFNSILYYNTKRDKCQYLYLHYLSKLVNNSYEKQLLTLKSTIKNLSPYILKDEIEYTR